MANAIYPLYKQALMQADANVDLIAETVKVSLVDTGVYTYSAAHQFYSDLSGVVQDSGALTTKACGTDGSFDSDNVTWTSVTGNSVEALVIWIDTTVAGTSRLVAYIDTGQTGLPVTPNGGDITYTVDASGWFTL